MDRLSLGPSGDLAGYDETAPFGQRQRWRHPLGDVRWEIVGSQVPADRLTVGEPEQRPVPADHLDGVFAEDRGDEVGCLLGVERRGRVAGGELGIPGPYPGAGDRPSVRG